MVTEEYQIAYTEVLEILKNIPFGDYKKIPVQKIQLFETHAKKDYPFSYHPEISLEEQNVSEKAKTILALLFRDYWATSEQREKIMAKENFDRQKLEEKKQEKYNSEGLFQNEKIDNSIKEENSLLEIKNQKWYEKFLEKIKKIFFKI